MILMKEIDMSLYSAGDYFYKKPRIPKSELEKLSNIIILRIFVSFISYEIISDISEQTEEFLVLFRGFYRIIVAGRRRGIALIIIHRTKAQRS